MRLRQRFFLAIFGVMGGLVAVLALYILFDQFREINAKKEELAGWLADGALAAIRRAGGDPAKAERPFDRQFLPGLTGWWLADPEGKVLRASAPGPPDLETLLEAARGGRAVLRGWGVAAPVRDGGRLKAVVAANVDTSGAWYRSRHDLLATHLWIMLLGGLILCLIVYVLEDRLFVRPIAHLHRAALRAAQGDLAPVADPSRGPEIAAFVRAFNAMLEELRGYRESMEAKVAQAQREAKERERSLVIAQRLAAMGTLAAGLAHELNNPLGGLLNAARALGRGDLAPEKEREYLRLLEEGLVRLQERLGGVLRFARGRLDPRPLDLPPILEGALALVRHRVAEAGIEARLDAPADLPKVYGDGPELEQVFLNLFLNAVEAMGKGGVLKARAASRDGRVRVEVEDTGKGMSPPELARAFDFFYTTKGERGGTGLGLSIAHLIVANHEGTLSLSSEEGKGTTAVVELPAA